MEYIKIRDIDLSDTFFDSLRNEYFGFDKWFIKERNKNSFAYATFKNNHISAFMMWKIENESEDYSKFSNYFRKCKRLKIQTFKVFDTHIGIGTKFMEIINMEALKNNVSEIYITLFSEHDDLINFLLKEGFINYGFKITKKTNGRLSQELVFIKKCLF